MHRHALLTLLPLLALWAPPALAQMTETHRLLPPEGLSASDNFGESSDISADGRTILAVSRSHGALVFHRLDSGEWGEPHLLIPSISLALLDPMWVELSADGKTALLGARRSHPDPDRYTGAVVVFRLTDGVWEEDAVLVGFEAEDGARFGDAMAVTSDGSVVVVGARWEDLHASDPPTPGAVYVFRRRTSGRWIEKARLVAEPGRLWWLGRGIDVSDDARTLVVQYPDDPNYGGDKSRVVVYSREAGSNDWAVGTVIENEGASHGFGFALDLSPGGDLLLVGDPYGSRAYVYRRVSLGGRTTWMEEAVWIGLEPNWFGFDVSLMGNREAAVVLDTSLGGAGEAFVYERRSGEWEEVAHLAPSDPPGPYGLYHKWSCVSGADDRVAVGRDADRILYVYDLPGVFTAAEPSPVSDTSERLSPSRPNPFVGEAQVTLRLGQPEHVEAVLYDALGRSAARPFSGPAPSGETTVSIEGHHLAPGLYLLRVSGEGWQETRRLVRAER